MSEKGGKNTGQRVGKKTAIGIKSKIENCRKEDGKTVVLEFSQKNKTDWIIMGTVKGSLAPAQVMLNGNPVSFEYASGMIRIPGHVRGDIKIEISFN